MIDPPPSDHRTFNVKAFGFLQPPPPPPCARQCKTGYAASVADASSVDPKNYF